MPSAHCGHCDGWVKVSTTDVGGYIHCRVAIYSYTSDLVPNGLACHHRQVSSPTSNRQAETIRPSSILRRG